MLCTPDVTIQLEAPSNYHLGRSMTGLRMGAFDPILRIEERTVRFAFRTPEGPSALEIEERREEIEVRGWGAGAGWLAQHLDGLLGLKDRPQEFQPTHPVVQSLWRRFSGIHLPRPPQIFHRVVQVVLLQRVSWRDGCSAWKRLVHGLGEEAPGPPGLLLPPPPRTLASVPYYELVGLGVPHRQARTIQQVAFRARRIEEAAEAGIEDFSTVLSALPGIGPWTIGYLRGSALADPDAVLPGDLNLPHSVAWTLAGEDRADEKRMLELLEPFRPHRFRVIRLLWMAGAHAPNRRPRG